MCMTACVLRLLPVYLLCALPVQVQTLTEVNIAPLATITVSSTLTFLSHNYSKYNLHDGRFPDDTHDTDACNCCFSTGGEAVPFLEATFIGHFVIERIVLTGRRENFYGHSDLSGLTVLLDGNEAVVRFNENNQRAEIYPAAPCVKSIMIKRPNKLGKPWFLVICEIEIFAKALNVAGTAALRASNPEAGRKENVIDDFSISGNFYDSTCYSSNSSAPYFFANFGHPVHARVIEIIGSRTYSTSFAHMSVSLDNITTSLAFNWSTLSATVTPQNPIQTILIEEPSSQRGQRLAFCEMGVFVADCATGYYGDGCTQTCESCGGSGVCGWDGTCIDGCLPGYQGSTCKEHCPVGKFGINCNQTCHCINNDDCDNVTGQCQNGCESGWTGHNCSTACSDGTFGPGCLHQCHCLHGQSCDRQTGHCLGQCDSGWTGYNCSLACDRGKYGPDCQSTCHCSGDSVCDKVTGACTSCAAGWTGSNCNTACPDGTFGPACQYMCHCKYNLPCNKELGICPRGCDFGWTGQNCSTGHTINEAVMIGCSSNSWNVVVNLTSLRILYPSSVVSDIYLGDNSCTGTETNEQIQFQNGFEECLTSKTTRNGYTVYSNELVYAFHDPVQPFLIRNFNWTVPVECEINTLGEAHGRLSHDASPAVSTLGNRTYSVSLKFYQDPNFQTEVRGNPVSVPVGSQVYVKVYTATADWGVRMRVDTCYIKPAVDAQDHLKVDIIKHGCEIDANAHLLSQYAHETRLVFQQFAYTTGHEGLFLFCNVVFCNVNDVSDKCSQTCHPSA